MIVLRSSKCRYFDQDFLDEDPEAEFQEKVARHKEFVKDIDQVISLVVMAFLITRTCSMISLSRKFDLREA